MEFTTAQATIQAASCVRRFHRPAHHKNHPRHVTRRVSSYVASKSVAKKGPCTKAAASLSIGRFTSGNPIGADVFTEDLGREAAAVQPLEQFGGAFFDCVPVALRVGAEQLVPGGLGVHGVSFRETELPGKGNAGVGTELFRFVPGKLAAE